MCVCVCTRIEGHTDRQNTFLQTDYITYQTKYSIVHRVYSYVFEHCVPKQIEVNTKHNTLFDLIIIN